MVHQNFESNQNSTETLKMHIKHEWSGGGWINTFSAQGRGRCGELLRLHISPCSVPRRGHDPFCCGLHKVFTPSEFSCQHPLVPAIPPHPSTHTFHRLSLCLAFGPRKVITDLERKSGSLHAVLVQRCFALTLTSAYDYKHYMLSRM